MTSVIRSRLQQTILTSNNLEEDLLFLVIDIAQDIHQVDLYNLFLKHLEKAKECSNNTLYEALANTMDIIWAGNTGFLQLYPNVLTDQDFEAREASKKIFGKKK